MSRIFSHWMASGSNDSRFRPHGSSFGLSPALAGPHGQCISLVRDADGPHGRQWLGRHPLCPTEAEAGWWKGQTARPSFILPQTDGGRRASPTFVAHV
ncbi:hypothetical protein NPIL_133521 [Nephila pilipes]|uniref:Uncharacterized protein n=1 Tax=Nephila pilipes TaxID=299642 RepID=A0A8X6T8S0_NEPPI|nr:hypothetical protein NPIL_133521 [Nephila pilipes]